MERLILLNTGIAHLQEPVSGTSYCGRTMDLKRTDAHALELRRGEYKTCQKCVAARRKAEEVVVAETPNWALGTTRKTLHRVTAEGVGECGWAVLPGDQQNGWDRSVRPGCRNCIKICMRRGETIPTRLLAAYEGPGADTWKDEKDVNEVVNTHFRTLPEWMFAAQYKGSVAHKREAPDSLVSYCGIPLNPTMGIVSQSDTRRCGRCVRIQEKLPVDEPWGGGEMVVSGDGLPTEDEELEAAERVLGGGNEWTRGHRHHADPPANETRGREGEPLAQVVARLRRQNKEMGDRWNRRVAGLQSELDGFRNLVREGDEFARRYEGGDPSVLGREVKAVTSLLNRLRLVEEERDAFRDRMHKSNLKAADDRRKGEEYRRAMLNEQNRMNVAVRQALMTWGGDTLAGSEKEIAQAVLDEIYREEQVRGPRR